MSAPIIKFKTSKWSFGKKGPIERIECTRETEKSVFVRDVWLGKVSEAETRHDKTSNYSQYHDSWRDAHAYLLANAERDVMSARLALESAQGHLGNIKGMKQPEDAK